MAASFDSANGNTGYPPSGISFSHTLGDGSGNNRIVLVGINSVGGADVGVTSCTYNGTAMTALGSIHEEYFGRDMWTFVYYLLDSALPASSGSYTVSATVSGTTVPYDGVVEALSYIGVKQVAPPYSTSSDWNNPAFDTVEYSTNRTVVADSGILVDFGGCEDNGATAQAPSTGQTERQDRNYNSSLLAASEKAFTSSGSNSMGQTPNGQYWSYAHVVVELEDADTEGIGILGTGGPFTAQSPNSSISGSYTCHAGTNRKLLVCTTSEEDPVRACNSVTYNSVNLTQIGSEYTHGANTVSWWYLDDADFPTPGSYTVQANYSGSVDPGVLCVIEIENAKQGSLYDENSSLNSSTDTLNTTINTGVDDSWIFGGIVCGSAGNFTPDSGQTELFDISAGGGGMTTAVGYEEIASSGATNMQWQYNTGANRLLQMVIAVSPFEEVRNAVMTGTNF